MYVEALTVIAMYVEALTVIAMYVEALTVIAMYVLREGLVTEHGRKKSEFVEVS